MFGRISNPRRGTTLAISLLNPMTINLGTFTGWTEGAGNEYIESILDVTGNAVLSYLLDRAEHVSGGQVQDVRTH